MYCALWVRVRSLEMGLPQAVSEHKEKTNYSHHTPEFLVRAQQIPHKDFAR